MDLLGEAESGSKSKFGFGRNQAGGKKILGSWPRSPRACPRMRSQTMFRSWQNWHFARDILKKWPLLNILSDAFLGAVARFLDQLLDIIGSTTGCPGGPPNMVQKLIQKSRHCTEECVRKDVQNWPLSEDVSREMPILPTSEHPL